MHELSIASELYQGLRSEIDGLGGGRLRGATIVVGELSAIEPKLLHFAWEAVTADGPDEGATLTIDWRTVQQSCPLCGKVEAQATGGWLRLCPDCDVPLHIEGGRELDITSLTYDEPDSSHSGSGRFPEPLESKS